jgi:nucleotide-binding universal stress UspA family protein
MGTKILIPLDGSELAEAVLPYAEQIGKALGWSAVLLSVVPGDPLHHHAHGVPLVEGTMAAASGEESERAATYQAIREYETAAMDMLAGPGERLRTAGLQVVREVGLGSAADVIVERAGADDVALVLIASHGRTGLARLFRGSVADGVVHHTRRPTLVVRPFRDAAQRVDLEHAEHLPAEQVDALRRVLDGLAGQ